MIRIRKANGELVELPKDVAFVELTDSLGNIGYVLTFVGNDVLGFDADSTEGKRYAKLYNVTFCPSKPI